jgi:EAL domain-containing protein (putative c-di-GMP-specific phosphodiesterase class I)
LLADIAHAGDALRVAGRMREGLNEPFLLQNQNVVVSASVGLVAVPPSFGEPRAIIRHAETALGRAKQQGAGGEEVFDEVMREEARARIELESALHDAVSKRVFEAHYQPIVAVETGRTMGLEALVRWHRPGLGSVSPEAFLSVAEDLGLAEEIDLLVLERALETLCRLRQTVPDLYVTVNLSGPTLHDSRFVEAVKSRLADSGVPPSALVLEVTESALIEEEREVARRMERLRKLGVRFALDDFGTGYASLSYLRSYPFDVLKIDRSFVGRREPGAGSAGPALLEGIVALGRHLGLTLVAEGIESEEHLETARSTGCPFAQGPWFSPPADEAGAARWLEASPRHP